MYSYQPTSGKWNKVIRGKPATEKQQAFLIKLGWGREDLTAGGAWVLINAIINS